MSIFSIKRGDDRTLPIAVTDSDDGDDAVDLTGASLWFLVKRYRDDADADALVAKTLGSGITLVSAVGGTAEVAIAAADTADAATGMYYWELQSRAGSATTTLAEGRLEVRPDLVRA